MNILAVMTDLARHAGMLLRQGLANQPQVELKSPYEAVTDLDRACEALIVDGITTHFPDHAILAEEGTRHERSSAFLWVIDPLDGTNNYVHGYPYFCVSIGVLYDGVPTFGVIYDPLRDELYAAERGRGALCNNQPIHVSQTTTMAAALLSTGFAYNFAQQTDNNLAQFVRVQSCTQGVRRPGAAALDLAYVACGRSDAHWELVLKPWDVAAGLVLVHEAGGVATDHTGQPATIWSESFVVSNGRIHRELMNTLWPTT